MGRGKTSAAIAYMTANKDTKRFIFITPYLKEVKRICENCDFEQPDSDHTTKLKELKAMLRRRGNISTTHALFYLLDEEALNLIRSNKYSIIIDEAIETIRKVQISSNDMKIVCDVLTDEADDGMLVWKDPTYSGKFSECKEMADAGTLYKFDSALLCIMKPDVLKAFDEVVMMTYLSGGQYQKAYLDYFGLDYMICGIDNTDGFKFTQKPDAPPPLNFKELITIVDSDKFNSVGEEKFALSKNWYDRRGYDDKDIRRLRTNLNTFFRGKNGCSADGRIWTTFKTHAWKIDSSDHRFGNSFVQLSERATNEYRERDHVAYLANRFADPNIKKFFSERGIFIDEDQFALGEMIQFIWRSSIRDNKPITVYIPSRRMRELFIDWINSLSEGSENND